MQYKNTLAAAVLLAMIPTGYAMAASTAGGSLDTAAAPQSAPTAPAASSAPARGPSGDCDPYKNFDCLNDYLGTGFWERLTNYYKLEWGQATAPTDPKAPASRRADWSAFEGFQFVSCRFTPAHSLQTV